MTAFPAVAIAVGTLVSQRAHSQTIPALRVGSLTAYPTVVQTGTKPTLTWSINYPSVVEDFVTITPPNSIVPKERRFTGEIRR